MRRERKNPAERETKGRGGAKGEGTGEKEAEEGARAGDRDAEGEKAMSRDLRARATAFLARARGPARAALDEVPMFIESGGAGEPVAATWSEFVQLVLSRFVAGDLGDDPEVNNNLAVLLMGLEDATEPDLTECREILTGIWTQRDGD